MYLKTEYTFDAAHNLVAYHGKCERLHGHTYRMAVTLQGDPGPEGMIIDFLEVKRMVHERILNLLDHSYLNDVIPQPTAENICLWIWERLVDGFPEEEQGASLFEVQVWETASNSAIIRKDLS